MNQLNQQSWISALCIVSLLFVALASKKWKKGSKARSMENLIWMAVLFEAILESTLRISLFHLPPGNLANFISSLFRISELVAACATAVMIALVAIAEDNRA